MSDLTASDVSLICGPGNTGLTFRMSPSVSLSSSCLNGVTPKRHSYLVSPHQHSQLPVVDARSQLRRPAEGVGLAVHLQQDLRGQVLEVGTDEVLERLALLLDLTAREPGHLDLPRVPQPHVLRLQAHEHLPPLVALGNRVEQLRDDQAQRPFAQSRFVGVVLVDQVVQVPQLEVLGDQEEEGGVALDAEHALEGTREVVEVVQHEAQLVEALLRQGCLLDHPDRVPGSRVLGNEEEVSARQRQHALQLQLAEAVGPLLVDVQVLAVLGNEGQEVPEVDEVLHGRPELLFGNQLGGQPDLDERGLVLGRGEVVQVGLGTRHGEQLGAGVVDQQQLVEGAGKAVEVLRHGQQEGLLLQGVGEEEQVALRTLDHLLQRVEVELVGYVWSAHCPSRSPRRSCAS